MFGPGGEPGREIGGNVTRITLISVEKRRRFLQVGGRARAIAALGQTDALCINQLGPVARALLIDRWQFTLTMEP